MRSDPVDVVVSSIELQVSSYSESEAPFVSKMVLERSVRRVTILNIEVSSIESFVGDPDRFASCAFVVLRDGRKLLSVGKTHDELSAWWEQSYSPRPAKATT
jgi:hypothetical protein